MTKRQVLICASALAILMAAAARGTQPRSAKPGPLPFACAAAKCTAVRFFFNPENGGYYHFPLIFRAVPPGSARLNTAPMGPEGRTAYITHQEMTRLLQELAAPPFVWRVSHKIERLGSFRHLIWFPNLRILVVCSVGTAWAEVKPSKICGTLAPVDSTLATPRALWEFQLLRMGYGCKVPGFNWNAYPGSH